MSSVNPFRFDPLARFRDPRSVDDLLRRPEDFGATPGIVPQGSIPPSSLPPALQTVAAGGNKTPASQAANSPAAPTLSPVDLILSKAGRVGEFLQPVADFGGQLGDSFRNTARSGALAGVAPNFTRGVLAGDQNRRADERAELQRQLIESRIGLQGAQQAAIENPANANPAGANVQSTFEGANGNMFMVFRDGRDPVDTGIPFRTGVQLVEQPDKSVVAVDTTTGQVIGTPITPEQAANASTTEQIRQDETKANIELPERLAKLDSTTRRLGDVTKKIDDAIDLVKPSTVGVEVARAGLPGFLGGEVRTLSKAIESLQANFGFDTLQEMRAASQSGGALGQVSERELNLLVNALESIDQGGDPVVLRQNLEAVKAHYNNYINEIERMKDVLSQRAGQTTDEFEGFSIVDDES